ncbi:hypothetical protein PHLGIDRAFT_19580 [Phlebiopsis gigantea 11061_1 CR5-6]|uniref:LysM domain-containing protein n=1 Tax=Phlebiopsis gigantea (strain 11061_1 CR5-6) TaxID=745531 RepID=A0A0C3RWF3_PHLG1|nr:hypothetical protein PHLGIDRAFT_19580 [Phlebiopsis gigantea 11061_1 CR5-6]
MFASSVVAALVALPLFVQSAAAADCSRTYTVVAGDICDSISANHNVSTYQLAVMNPGIDKSCNNLLPGQELCLGAAGKDCTTTYVVKSGDSCEQIVSNHGINSTILYANNPQIDVDCSNIYVGEVLCAASEFAAPSASVIPATTIPTGAVPAATSSSTSFAASSVTSSATSSVTSSATFTPTPSPTPASTTSSAAASSTATEDGDDDDDLPFCDEL